MAERRVRRGGVADPRGERWEGYAWSPWRRIDKVFLLLREEAPAVRGIYRIRHRRHRGLLYIGMTDSTIHNRLRALRAAVALASNRKPAAYHVAGRCVSVYLEKGHAIEISWLELPSVDRREILGIECELIGAHRKAVGRSPTCQFAALPRWATLVE